MLNNINENIESSNELNINGNIIKNYEIDFLKLKEKNKDTVGWIKVNNTDIEYPVLKGEDNSYYLIHDFEKNNNSAGWIFANYSCKCDGTDKNMTIFGHNRRNGTMFESLKNVITKEWCENTVNRYILFKNENKTIVYETFSVYEIKAENYYIKNDFKNKEEYKEFLDIINSRSVYGFNVNLSAEDNIITLSTCADDNRYRIVLHAKQIEY